MTPEQIELNRVYTYHYKNMDWKHATAWRQTLLKHGRATKASEQFVKIVNFIKKREFPGKYSVNSFLE